MKISGFVKFRRLAILLFFLMIAGGMLSYAIAEEPPVTASLIVKMVSGLSTEEQAAVIASNGGTEISSIQALRLHIVEVPTSDLSTIIQNYQTDPRVISVEENKTRKAEGIPSDLYYGSQWALPQIDWDMVFETVIPYGTATVAVLDTGVDSSHDELAGKLITCASILDGSDCTSDPHGHGTWLAGIVAANTDNNNGIAGVGYAGVKIMPVTVLGADGTGQDSDIIAGIVSAVESGADVILMGFSNPGFSQNLQDAIDYAWSQGVVLVAATGNDSVNTPTFPAGDRGVIGVSATDQSDNFVSFSNYGQDVFLAAPGVNIETIDTSNSFTSISGTSPSAAIVAGAAAFMRAVEPGLSNGIIVGRLARNADPAGDPVNDLDVQLKFGNGRINMARSLEDTSTDPVQPAGADPVGDGGPYVGPYVVAARNWVVTFAGTGSGSVTITVPGPLDSTHYVDAPSSCGGTGSNALSQTVTSTCSPNISTSPNGATVTFNAIANSGSIFDGWSGQANLSCTTNPCSTVIGQNAALTVTFRATVCGDGTPEGSEECDLGSNNGKPGYCCSSTCQYVASGTECRASAGVCNVADYCTGSGAACPADVKSTAVCRPKADICDVADSCDGVNNACPADAKQPSGTDCTDDGNVCTLDQCNGTDNACQHPAGNAGTVCRAPHDACDPTEYCTGLDVACPIDIFDTCAPIVTNVLANPNPVAAGKPIPITATIDDSGMGNSNIKSADYKIDNGPWTPMNGTFNSPTVSVTATILSLPVDVYNICVRGTDIADNIGSEECTFLAVFDPSAGFVTGGGWIVSPEGACKLDSCEYNTTGKANFGFVSKYKKGANVPTGNTEFQFKAGNLNFHSETYDWLVVAGTRAQYKGVGTINGEGYYKFLLTAIDNQNRKGVFDKFRIKIWDDYGTVYDNKMGASDTGDDATELDGVNGNGSIVIHK